MRTLIFPLSEPDDISITAAREVMADVTYGPDGFTPIGEVAPF